MLHYVTAVSHPATKIGSGSVTGNLPDALEIRFHDETEILTPGRSGMQSISLLSPIQKSAGSGEIDRCMYNRKKLTMVSDMNLLKGCM